MFVNKELELCGVIFQIDDNNENKKLKHYINWLKDDERGFVDMKWSTTFTFQ